MNCAIVLVPSCSMFYPSKAFRNYELSKRNEVAAKYTAALKDKYTIPFVSEGMVSSWAQYTLLFNSAKERDAVQVKLKDAGVPSMVYYPRPLHLQTCYKYLGYPEGSLPNAEKACHGVLSLPMSPWISEEDQDKVIEVLLEM